ncbi:MAG: Gfo/Idh/MocA family oxidoreductase, partial [Actinobacteria bacterium]|nr:Gfo/Idh/MocA family oxidoreductase [Actinomycetota bacterium]
MHDGRIRWGVLSTAKIARNRLIPAIQASRNGALAAVASRELDRARACAQEFAIPRAHGSYQELLDDPDVDAVYVPLPTSLHHEWTLRAAAAGKHVLCDKPLAADVRQAQEMVDACRRAGVQLADGFMFRHDPRHARVLELIATGAVGELRRVRAAFAFPIVRDAANVRLAAGLDGGALGDVGCYGVSASCLYFNGLPDGVLGTLAIDREFGVDMDGSALLDF